jgi:hypothetical protein
MSPNKILYAFIFGLLVLASATPALALDPPAYMSIVSYAGFDTALIDADAWRASADYPAIIGTKPEPTETTYYNVIVQDNNGYYRVVNNAWVMKSDMLVYGIEADPLPEAPHFTPTPDAEPTTTPGSMPGSSNWYKSVQGAIDFYFANLLTLTLLEIVAVLVLMIRKVQKSFKKIGRSSR